MGLAGCRYPPAYIFNGRGPSSGYRRAKKLEQLWREGFFCPQRSQLEVRAILPSISQLEGRVILPSISQLEGRLTASRGASVPPLTLASCVFADRMVRRSTTK